MYIPFKGGEAFRLALHFVEIGPVVLEKKMKLWKFTTTDDRQILFRKAYLSFRLWWAKMYMHIYQIKVNPQFLLYIRWRINGKYSLGQENKMINFRHPPNQSEFPYPVIA